MCHLCWAAYQQREGRGGGGALTNTCSQLSRTIWADLCGREFFFFFWFAPFFLDFFMGAFQCNNLKEVFKTKWMLQLGNFFNHPNEFCYWCYQHRVNASPNINHSDNLLDELRRWVMSHLALWALWTGTKIYRLLKSGNCFMRAHLRAINYVSMLELRFMIKVWEKSNMVRQSL